MTPEENIISKIRNSIEIIDIKLEDDSARHAGHAGAVVGGNSHFKLWVVSPHFAGLSPIARHRLIYDILKTEMNTHIHALNIVAKTPDEIRG